MRIDFIPGTMCDERIWSRLLARMTTSVDAHHVPLGGSLDRDALGRALFEHVAPRANLVGFSMGGYLALEFALAHPERVNSLTIVAASAKGMTASEKLRRQRVLDHLRDKSYSGIPMGQIMSLLGKASHDDTEAIAIIRDMDRDLGKETLLSQLSAMMERADRTEDLRALQCPVLIVGATGDPLVQVDDLQRMHAVIAGSRLEIFDCGHMIPLEQPQALAEVLSGFLRSLP